MLGAWNAGKGLAAVTKENKMSPRHSRWSVSAEAGELGKSVCPGVYELGHCCGQLEVCASDAESAPDAGNDSSQRSLLNDAVA